MRKIMDMLPMKKKTLLIFVVLIFSILFNAVGAQLCPPEQRGLDFIHSGHCPILTLSFLFMGTGLFLFFLLPLIGLYFVKHRVPIPDGFRLSLFRPPRFHA
jgi:hypothetical protein